MSNSSINPIKSLKPELKPFLYYNLIKFSLTIIPILLIIRLIIAAAAPETGAPWLFIVFLALVGLKYWTRSVRYKKEEYLIYPEYLIHKGGGVFSDFETELKVKNITHVTMSLPFIEHKLFSSGYIKVQSAGSAGTEIYFKSIHYTNLIYEQIIKIMKNNGFKLNREKVIQKEKPHILAVFFDVFRSLVSAVFVMLFIGLRILGEVSLGDVQNLLSRFSVYLILGGIVVALFFLARCFFQFMDLVRRVYILYDDTISYAEGFLTKNYSVIPIENLSDSAITQNMISKIFRLYDIKLSCQGSGHEILFKNMVNGERLSANIDELIANNKTLIQKAKEEAVIQKPNIAADKAPKRQLQMDRDYEAEFRMDPLKTWMSLILLAPICLIILPLGLFVVGSNIVQLIFNVFKVKRDSVEHTFNFLSRKTTEFSFDKITGIILKESFIDKWCKTCSVLFWSIGSGENIVFKNIKKKGDFFERILSKKGITNQKVLHQIKADFNFADFLKANMYFFILLAIPVIVAAFFEAVVAIGILVFLGVVVVAILLYKNIYYANHTITFYQDYVHFKKGLLFGSEYFSLYDDIKDIATVQYPASSRGRITFNVAGETIVQNNQAAAAYGAKAGGISNAFTVNYVKSISIMDELIDIIFHNRPGPEKINELLNQIKDTSSAPLHSFKPVLANSLFGMILALVFIDIVLYPTIYYSAMPESGIGIGVGIILINAIVLTLLVLAIKAISYNIEDYRVFVKSGIIFKKQLSIIYEKIDFINFSQGPINKMFGNGNVTIHTTGSSKPEIQMVNTREFKKLYSIIKEFDEKQAQSE